MRVRDVTTSAITPSINSLSMKSSGVCEIYTTDQVKVSHAYERAFLPTLKAFDINRLCF